MKPLLAETVEFNLETALESLSSLKFPLLASPKLDGVRAVIRDGQVMSRKLLPIPNAHVQRLFARPDLFGMDGELIVGCETDPDVYNRTTSAVMSRDGEPEVVYRIFDRWDAPSEHYRARYEHVLRVVASCTQDPARVAYVPQMLCKDAKALVEYEQAMVERGYEGVMIRNPFSPYKYGRSTLREGYLLKIKRFADSEAEVIGAEEAMENRNELQRDELGHAKRSTHKANLVGKGTLGALLVRDLKSGVEFSIGTGMDQAQRDAAWRDFMFDRLVGRIVKYRYQPVGVKDKPRFPSFIGFRDAIDMS